MCSPVSASSIHIQSIRSPHRDVYDQSGPRSPARVEEATDSIDPADNLAAWDVIIAGYEAVRLQRGTHAGREQFLDAVGTLKGRQDQPARANGIEHDCVTALRDRLQAEIAGTQWEWGSC